MIDGWNARCAFINLLNLLLTTPKPRRNNSQVQVKRHAASVFVLGQRDSRSHRQNVSLGSRLALVVKPHCAVRTKIIRISSLGGMAALDAVHSTSRDHFTFSIYNQINFFRCFMMMRKVRTSRREVHPE